MARNRPVVATVFGVLNIVFGGLAVLGMLWALARVGPLLVRGITVEWEREPMYPLWWVASSCVRLLVSGVLVLAGVGLLTLRPWGRPLSIGYAIFAIAFVLATAVVNALLLAARGHVVWAAAAGLARMCVGLLYPVVLLVFMLHPSVAAALREASQPQVSGPTSA